MMFTRRMLLPMLLATAPAFAAVQASAAPLTLAQRLQGESQLYQLQHRDAQGVVKPDGLIQGTQARQAMLQQQSLTAAAPSPAAGISSSGWTSLGPTNIGGRIRAILSDPNTGYLFIGAVDGGIWVSKDGGSTWSAVNDFMGSIAVCALAEDPTNGYLFAGTGEGYVNADAVRGSGMFVSTDHGATWTALSATDPASNIDWYHVNQIAINSNGVMLAATGGDTGGTYISGHVYRSTDDGATWSQGPAVRSLSVQWDPNIANNAIIDATSDYSGNPTIIEYSTDKGQSWTQATVDATTTSSFGAGHSALAYAKSIPNEVYASVDQNGGEVFRSTDGGHTWSQLTTPAYGSGQSQYSVGYKYLQGGQGWYDNVLWVDPTDAAHLIVGGVDLFQSTDGGSTWTQISDWTNTPTSPHADHHAIVADSGFNGTTDTTVYFGNDGGIYSAADPATATMTSGWTSLNSGLGITQFYSAAGHTGVTASANNNIVPIVGGAQDNGSLLYSGNANGWTSFLGGDGGVTAVDPSDGNYVYGEYTNLDINQSTDGGQSATDIAKGVIADAGSSTTANFIAPYVLDPNDTTGNTMYAGGIHLWQSTDLKAATPAFSSAISTGLINDTTTAYNFINAIAVAQGNANDIWVGYDYGQVYHQTGTSLSAPTWVQLGSGTLPSRAVLSITVMPNPTASSETVYVTFGGYAADNVWRGVYNGTAWTWTDLTASTTGFPQVPVYSLAVNPGNSNWLYAGTDVGVFTSTDGGTTWATTNDGPANVRVDQLTWYDTSTITPALLAATHGRGVFKISVPTTPAISSISPASVAAGGGVFTLTVNGSNFTSLSSVQWNGAKLTTTYVGSSLLTASVPATDIATPGTATVTVTNNDGSATSNSSSVTIAAPAISSISPASVAAGGGVFTLTVNGSNFASASSVEWNGTALTTTYVSSSKLTATVPAADIATAGTATVTVASGSNVTSGVSVTIAAPAISGLSPASVAAGGGVFTLTVNGSNFVSASTVRWNGAALTTTYVNSSQLTASVPAADIATAGTAKVTVANGSNVSSSTSLIIAAPAISSLSPTSVTAGGSAFILTVNGSDFVSASTAEWNGTALTTTYVNSSQLTASVPAADIATVGSATVTVANGSVASPSASLTIAAAPAPAAPASSGGGGAMGFASLFALAALSLWRRRR